MKLDELKIKSLKWDELNLNRLCSCYLLSFVFWLKKSLNSIENRLIKTLNNCYCCLGLNISMEFMGVTQTQINKLLVKVNKMKCNEIESLLLWSLFAWNELTFCHLIYCLTNFKSKRKADYFNYMLFAVSKLIKFLFFFILF